MEKIYKLAQGLMKRFPKGVEPYQMATRLAEECGEDSSGKYQNNSGIQPSLLFKDFEK